MCNCNLAQVALVGALLQCKPTLVLETCACDRARDAEGTRESAGPTKRKDNDQLEKETDTHSEPEGSVGRQQVLTLSAERKKSPDTERN